MEEMLTGGLFNRFWRRFGDSKKLNFAKAIAEYLAEKLSIPISSSKQIMALRRFLERHFGEQLAEAGEDGLTILAKTLIHAPDQLIVFLAGISGSKKADVAVIVNQFLDELVKGIIKGHHEFETQAEAKNVIVQAAAMQDDDVRAADADKALTEILSVKYAYDTHRGDVHFIGCDEVNETVNVKDEGGGDGKDGDRGKKGPRRVKKLKSHVRELTLGDLIEFDIDPLALRPKCCGGVKPSDVHAARASKKPTSETKAEVTTLRLCLARMNEEGRTIQARIDRIVRAWSQDLLAATADPMQIGVLHLDKVQVEEVRDDYFMRPMWTPEVARAFMQAWNPVAGQSLFILLEHALETLHGLAPAKPKPKSAEPSKLDKAIDWVTEGAVAYLKGENSPVLDATRARVDQVTSGLHTGNVSRKATLNVARQRARQGR